jgi:hypothetical protein
MTRYNGQLLSYHVWSWKNDLLELFRHYFSLSFSRSHSLSLSMSRLKCENRGGEKFSLFSRKKCLSIFVLFPLFHLEYYKVFICNKGTRFEVLCFKMMFVLTINSNTISSFANTKCSILMILYYCHLPVFFRVFYSKF